ncbi:MAG TPA: hypothetical protein VM869_19810, partial [Enhygromyxa sp.]|nr:hypothetical protein [Enhygromyxa sp.]
MSDAIDADDPLPEFEAAKRKRRWISLGITAVVLAVLGAGWAWWRATGLPRIPSETERDVREAMDSIDTLPRELHALLAAEAMVELGRGRLPDAMLEAFEGVQSVPPETATLLMMRPFADDPDSLKGWTVACEAGVAAIVEVSETGDIDKLFADCHLGRWSLIDGTEARRKSAGRLILA